MRPDFRCPLCDEPLDVRTRMDPDGLAAFVLTVTVDPHPCAVAGFTLFDPLARREVEVCVKCRRHVDACQASGACDSDESELIEVATAAPPKCPRRWGP